VADITEAFATLDVGGKVTFLRFHTMIADVLVVGVTMGGDNAVVQYWDYSNPSAAKITLNVFKGPILDIDFHARGNLIAVSSKDGRVRVIDPRKQHVEYDFEPDETLKETRVIWTGEDRLITLGFAKGSRRSVSLWDIKAQKKLSSLELSLSQASMIPYFDTDTRMLFVSTVGSAATAMFEILDNAPYFDPLSTFNGQGDITGHFFLKKSAVDVRQVEIAKSVKLARLVPGGFMCFPVSWRVPRKRLEFFQDDIFTDTRRDAPLFTASDFFSNQSPSGREAEYYSLQPAGMTELSKAPEEEMTDRQKKYQETLKKKEEPKKFGVLGHSSADEVGSHFREVAKTMPARNRWDAVQDNTQQEVHDDEWD